MGYENHFSTNIICKQQKEKGGVSGVDSVNDVDLPTYFCIQNSHGLQILKKAFVPRIQVLM